MAMPAIRFEWDEAKNRGNRSNHGVSFDEAQTVFYDESGRFMADPDHSDDEDRFLLLGLSAQLRLLVVSHTFRSDTIRIISAWKATRTEERQYWKRR